MLSNYISSSLSFTVIAGAEAGTVRVTINYLPPHRSWPDYILIFKNPLHTNKGLTLVVNVLQMVSWRSEIINDLVHGHV